MEAKISSADNIPTVDDTVKFIYGHAEVFSVENTGLKKLLIDEVSFYRTAMLTIAVFLLFQTINTRADLEKVKRESGSTQELAVSSCKSLSSTLHPSGMYWVGPVDESCDEFKVYCEMETDGGGWTLVWSYTFTDFEHFSATSNAVTPRPSWPVTNSRADVPISTTPPLNETDYNAMEFSLWKQFGNEILVKSNINNWLVCSPDTGSFVEWQDGGVICKISRNVTDTCSDGPPPSSFVGLLYCGPSLRGGMGGANYYYFDGCTVYNMPHHDPCGQSRNNGLKNVENPHGNIFVR